MEDNTASEKRVDAYCAQADGIVRHVYTTAKAIRLVYKQVLVMWLLFAVIAAISYFFNNNIMQQHLLKNAENALSSMQAAIAADLSEPEMMLKTLSQSLRTMIVNGTRAELVYEFMKKSSAYAAGDARHQTRMTGLYGYFDVFGGQFIADGPENTPPQQRPWYVAAVKAQGEVTATPPYVDARTHGLVVSYARRIFSANGKPLAVIALDVPLASIGEKIAGTNLVEGGYGILLSAELDIIAHKNGALAGKAFSGINSDTAAIAEELHRGKEDLKSFMVNYMGEESIAFFRRLENGWYLGSVTPIDAYYSNAKNKSLALIGLYLFLATTLSVILLHNAVARDKADERLRVMFEATPLCATFWDRNFKIINCNREALKLFALSHKRIFCDRFYDFSPEYQPDGQASRDKMREFLKITFMEGYCRSEWMHQLLNGELMPCEKTFIRVHDGAEYLVAVYTRDLRELKAMMSEMHRIEIAEASNKAKSQFLAAMSHEIRTPMNAILGITEMQLQKETLARDIREAFNKIYTAGYTLLAIINDILDLSKIEAGKLELMPVKYELASLISDTVQWNLARISDKPIAFQIQADENLPLELYGDELRIKQILNNLLSNAFKYTKAGEVTLSVSAASENKREDPAFILVFRLSDTGQGMTEEQIHKIFDEYSRFNEEANRVIEGVGLGMTITQHLVHMMKGEIFMTSVPGRGSTFSVQLPQKKIGNSVLGKNMSEQLQNFDLCMRSMKIAQLVREPMPYGSVLIVDDLETNVFVARGLLAPYELSIDTASSGFEAIDKIQGGKQYDIVFMDHMMPKMDGVEATKILREQGYAGSIVALTANAVAGQAEMFLANGFDGFLSKPIDMRQMNAVLNRLIRDTMPPEAREAARRHKSAAGGNELRPALDQHLAKIFVRDAEKAIAVLEAIYIHRCRRDDDMHMFVVNIHAMKSALASVGEQELSAMAFSLEVAGHAENIAVMLNDTPAFLKALRAFIEKITPREEDKYGEPTIEEQASLRAKLLVILAACLTLEKKAAKKALAELQSKKWSRQTREQIDTMAEHLLHSDFEEIAGIAVRLLPKPDAPKLLALSTGSRH